MLEHQQFVVPSRFEILCDFGLLVVCRVHEALKATCLHRIDTTENPMCGRVCLVNISDGIHHSIDSNCEVLHSTCEYESEMLRLTALIG